MHETTLAKRYALALAGLAALQNQLEEIGQELTNFLTILRQTPELRLLLTDPTSSYRHQYAATNTLLTECKYADLTGKFLKLLVSKRRMVLIDSIVASYIRELEARSGRITVHVTTPMAIPQILASRLQDMLSQVTGKTVNLEHLVKPELLGGAVIRIESLMLDYSVRSQLNRLQAYMKG